MLNIVMPIAGAGSRFKKAGYTQPKPFIPVHGQAMWELVRDNVKPKREHHLHLIAQQPRDAEGKRTQYFGGRGAYSVSYVEGLTEGAVCTVLQATQFIDSYRPLLIVNGDQYIDGLDINAFLDEAKDYDGFIMTFDVKGDDPKWSFVKIDKYLGGVTEVAEKRQISNEATCGIYWFKHGRDFLRAAHSMITRDIRTNGEFYLCPVYNEMLREGLDIGAWKVNEHAAKMHGLGTPEDLEKFIADCDPPKR